MSVEHVEFLVEEPSMETFLRALLPRMLGNLTFNVYPFQCKDEMLRRLPERLRGYASWLPDTYRIVVVVDRDDDDCHKLKNRLEDFAQSAGLTTRSRRRGRRFKVVNRIVIEELESWYFGDWDAVRAVYPRVTRTIPARRGYRDPDSISGGTWEAFERLLQQAGYFKTGLRKVEAATNIARNFVPERNTSRSFSVFHDAILEMVT